MAAAARLSDRGGTGKGTDTPETTLKERRFRRIWVVACACVLSTSICALADSPRRVDIPAGDLTAALDLLARQSGVEFVYSAEQLEGLRTQGVHGELTAEKAVAKLLAGTQLILTVHPRGAILIAPRPSLRSPDTTKDDAGATIAATQSIVRPFWDRIRLALIGAGLQAEQGSTAGGGSGKGTSSGGGTLAEIIVTASKRLEPLAGLCRVHSRRVAAVVGESRLWRGFDSRCRATKRRCRDGNLRR